MNRTLLISETSVAGRRYRDHLETCCQCVESIPDLCPIGDSLLAMLQAESLDVKRRLSSIHQNIYGN